MGECMSNKQKLLIAMFVILLFAMNVMSETMTNGIILNAYKPYKGVVIALDSGHGGKDDGARKNGLKEQDLNLIFTRKLKEQLEMLGIKVILTRTDENDLASLHATNRKQEDMKKRIDIINQKKVDFFISIHMNAYADTSVKGSQLFYCPQDEDSHLFASYIQEAITPISHSKMEIKTGNYYILKNSHKIGVLLECGFISNVEEAKRLSNEKYQDEFVKGIKTGIMNFLSNVYE
ncbi:MAG: N-acetylmuramoyl-L-alanine amidase [Erysipelotrichia bacterium]|nr:N-acetylmuramoyl-L-alanine amidase [Erysipelotrichia bacterium]NCC55300.1 N-acetylmuramoyl-L-alanine amidase [Erysipelotrichia bacterium]